jgi:hypothetical protein
VPELSKPTAAAGQPEWQRVPWQQQQQLKQQHKLLSAATSVHVSIIAREGAAPTLCCLAGWKSSTFHWSAVGPQRQQGSDG